MGDTTGIEWAESTWNPTVGCTKVSAGCDHCYAETLVNRFAPSKGFPNRFDDMLLRGDKTLLLPLSKKWATPRRIFVNSLSDLFHKDVPDEFTARVFADMAMADHHTFQVLTKRPGRMRSVLSDSRFWEEVEQREMNYTFETGSGWSWDGNPLPKVWLGVSVESQQWADVRIPVLRDTPAAVRWLSMEPLLGPVLLCRCDGAGYEVKRHPFLVNERCPLHGRDRIDWVVVGGESGPGSRPMHPDWVRSLRDQCVAAGVPFLFKQWGDYRPSGAGIGALAHQRFAYVGEPDEHGWRQTMERVGKKAAGRLLDGRTWDEYPAVTR